MLRNLAVIKLIQRLFIDQQITATQLVFDALNMGNLVHVVLQKWRLTTKIARHQTITDKDFARLSQIDLLIVGELLTNNNQTKQANLRVGFDAPCLFRPMRLKVMVL